MPFYYGWVIVLVSLITLLFAYGVWWSFPVFYVNILQEFGWTRADTALIFTIGLIVYGFGSLPAGALVDRLGPRKLLPTACSVVALGCLISSVANQKWHFYVAYGVFMGLGTICTGYVPMATLLSNWFVRKRGTAMGIALIGNVTPPLLAVPIQKLVSLAGWRASYAILAAVLLIFIVPLTGFLMRTRPQDLGMEPDGLSPSREEGKDQQRNQGLFAVSQEIVNPEWARREWNLLRGVRTYQFWGLAGVFLSLGIGGGMIMTHLVAMVVDTGHPRDLAALIFSLAGLAAAGGRLSGFLSDHLGREFTFTILTALFLCSLFALLFFLSQSQAWPLFLYAFAFGLGNGLTSPTLSAGAADLFGGRSFGAILGCINIFFGVGQGIGAWAGGAVFDHTGSYRLAVLASIPLFSIMCLFFWIAGPRKVRRIRPLFLSGKKIKINPREKDQKRGSRASGKIE